jgi:hypothetical protein
VQSTGNLYWVVNTINEFGPSSSSVYRAAKTGQPGTERLLYRENGRSFFGDLAYAKVGGIWYGYVSVRDNQPNERIVRFRLDGGGQPRTVVTSANRIGDLKSDGASLFWADNKGIRAITLTGGGVRTLVSGRDFDQVQLALSSSRLFYALGQQVRYVGKTGGTTTRFTTTSSEITALHVTVSPFGTTKVYWGERSGVVASKGLTGVSTIWQKAQTGRYTTSVSFDGARVLWSDCPANGLQCAVRFRSGNVTTTMAKNLDFAHEIQGDRLRTFWADGDGLKRYTY